MRGKVSPARVTPGLRIGGPSAPSGPGCRDKRRRTGSGTRVVVAVESGVLFLDMKIGARLEQTAAAVPAQDGVAEINTAATRIWYLAGITEEGKRKEGKGKRKNPA